jgi:hypothetical protein
MATPESRGPKPKKPRRDGPGPALQSLTLTPDTIPSGVSVNIEIGLDRPAPAGGIEVQVAVFKAGPDAVPGQTFGPGIPVLVGEGERTGSKVVPAVPAVAPGTSYDFRLEARLGDVSRTAMLRVVG